MVLPPAWTAAAQSWASYSKVNTASASPNPDPRFTLLSPTSTVDLSWLFPGGGAVALRLYKDTLVYAAVVASVCVLGWVGLSNRPLRDFLSSRPFGPALLLPGDPLALLAPSFPGSKAHTLYAPSVGGVFLLSAWGGLVIWWVWYWAVDYSRISSNAAEDPVSVTAHTSARALGHLCTLFLTMAILPLSKGGVWERVFGVPYERALGFHRLNGVLFWCAVTVHGSTWAWKWSEEGLLLKNLGATGSPTPLCIFAGTSPNCHSNNFTIPLMVVAWGVMTLAIGIAIFRRHLPWEVFSATHNYLLWVILAAELHAWSHWYHSLGALALYTLDRAARGGSATVSYTPFTLARLTEDTTLLEVLLPPGSPAAAHVTSGGPPPGAFYYVCIPAINSMQWHPFTAAGFSWEVAAAAATPLPGSSSSSGGGGKNGGEHPPHSKLTFAIRSMGKFTWTKALWDLAPPPP